MKKAKYKDLVFKTEKELKDFLIDHASFKILFEDHGQDLTCMYVDKEGEILDCNHAVSQKLYNGRFVNVNELHQYKLLYLLAADGRKWEIMGGLRIEEVII
jgi:hypothetical protein